MYQLLPNLSIIEASSFVASPTAGLYLAQMGAEVIRVDQIGGGPDFNRWPKADNGRSLYWENLNRAKKSVALDLGRAEGRELLAALVQKTGQFITNFPVNGFLAHDLLGFEALSSGAWYVAIDFQLYALLMALCHTLHTEARRHVSIAVATLCVMSMWLINRIDDLEIYAPYFFGAYGLGVLAAWAKRSRFDAMVFGITALLAVGALWLEFRTRLTLALVTAIWLAIKPKGLVHWTPMKRVVHRLANSAYVLFLTHFGVIVLFSDMWNRSHFYDPTLAFALTTFAWLCSVGMGLFLHEKAEVPMHHWISHHSKWVFLRMH